MDFLGKLLHPFDEEISCNNLEQFLSKPLLLKLPSLPSCADNFPDKLESVYSNPFYVPRISSILVNVMGKSFRESVGGEAYTSNTINNHIMDMIDLAQEYALGCSNFDWNHNKVIKPTTTTTENKRVRPDVTIYYNRVLVMIDAEKDLDEYFDFWNPLAFGRLPFIMAFAAAAIPTNEDELQTTIFNILEIVKKLHEMKVVHQDIFWENIKRLTNDSWILIDFEEVAKIGELRLPLNIAASEYRDGEDLCQTANDIWMMKYILVSGGVISGIGKGIFASSLGLLLKTLGLRVTAIKIDPYMNIDAGTMSPIEHDNNITTGKIYQKVINRERKGGYLGKTVQVVPHITDAIQEWVEYVSKIPVDSSGQEPDVCIIELGGTVGDIESAPFVEAMRQFQFYVGHENFALAHVSLVPIVGPVGEQKTKPTQATIKELRSLGLSPDLIVCRCSQPLNPDVRRKISMFCHVGPEQVVSVRDVSSTYHVPLLLSEQGVLKFLITRLSLNLINIKQEQCNHGLHLLREWIMLTEEHDLLSKPVTIAIVGKYTSLQDSYLSVVKALEHSGMKCGRRLVIKWVEATDLEQSDDKLANKYQESWKIIRSANGILVPGGFGNRGIEGKIAAARWARENKIPYLGICLGMQIAVIEFARNVYSNSEEFNSDAKNQVIINMPEISTIHLGGTMRLGLRPTIFQQETELWSKMRKLYEIMNVTEIDTGIVQERHRHRYEVNPKYVKSFESYGLSFVGRDETGQRMEIMEYRSHPFYVGTQYHPEYLSRPLKPSPAFLEQDRQS
ncbi:6497_t:CDS:10 [Entrophospora sp. SA101]|nr:6497_t:CDS:10 [Entrophospora sp. SA101]